MRETLVVEVESVRRWRQGAALRVRRESDGYVAPLWELLVSGELAEQTRPGDLIEVSLAHVEPARSTA